MTPGRITNPGWMFRRISRGSRGTPADRPQNGPIDCDRHRAAHTIIVIAGRLVANGQPLGPGGYAHFPGGTAMLHEPAEGHDCTFVLIFDGPFDLEVMESPDG